MEVEAGGLDLDDDDDDDDDDDACNVDGHGMANIPYAVFFRSRRYDVNPGNFCRPSTDVTWNRCQASVDVSWTHSSLVYSNRTIESGKYIQKGG